MRGLLQQQQKTFFLSEAFFWMFIYSDLLRTPLIITSIKLEHRRLRNFVTISNSRGGSHNQCDQIGPIFENVSETKVVWKVAQIFGNFWAFLKKIFSSKTCWRYFLATLERNRVISNRESGRTGCNGFFFFFFSSHNQKF